MATGVTAEFENGAEWMKRLGNVPLRRIRMNPPPGTATERDVIAIQAREDRLYELIDGTLVEKAMGFRESMIALEIGGLLRNHVREHNLGIVAGADGTLRLLGTQVRIPDVCFVSWDRLPGRKVPHAPIPDLVPDLAVEVLSESNTKGEMRRKLKEYFLAGVRLVWYVDPEKETVQVFTAPDESTVLAEADLLTAEDVLPGLTLPVRSIFESVPEQESQPARPASKKPPKRGRKK